MYQIDISYYSIAFGKFMIDIEIELGAPLQSVFYTSFPMFLYLPENRKKTWRCALDWLLKR